MNIVGICGENSEIRLLHYRICLHENSHRNVWRLYPVLGRKIPPAIPYAGNGHQQVARPRMAPLFAKHHHFLNTPVANSTVSSAAAEALTSVWRQLWPVTDSSELEFEFNRSFTSFRQAALENNWAWFYGGIPFTIHVLWARNMVKSRSIGPMKNLI